MKRPEVADRQSHRSGPAAGPADLSVLILTSQLRRRVPGGLGTYAHGLVRGLAEEEVSGWGTSPGLDGFIGRAVQHWPRLQAAPSGWRVIHASSLSAPRVPRDQRLVVLVADLAWRALPQCFPPRGRRWHEHAFGHVLRRADAVVTLAQETSVALRDAGVRCPVSVIPPGVDHLPSPDHAAATSTLQRHGVSGPFILTVGTQEPRKNLNRLLDAHAAALPQLPAPWPLVVVGPSGWGEPPQPRPDVVVLGSVPPALLSALYRRATLFVSVPLLEGFGLPAAEAMSCGTPVVATPMPSTRGAALDVDPRDVDAIADGIVTAARDDVLRRTLRTAGIARTEQLTWLRTARAHIELWRRLAG